MAASNYKTTFTPTYERTPGMKVTDMAIFIDKNIKKARVNGENPLMEETIFKYLYLIFYALSRRRKFFNTNEDYDGYAVYAASQTFLNMRKKLLRENRIIKGKKITPVKSSLNFIKSVLHPMKVDYQTLSFREVISPEIQKDFNVDNVNANLKASITQDYKKDSGFQEALIKSMSSLSEVIKKIIKKTPYRNDELMCKKLYISCMLSILNLITPQVRLQNKLKANPEANYRNYIEKGILRNDYIILWHLDDKLTNYIKILLVHAKREFKIAFSKLNYDYELRDDILENIISSNYTFCYGTETPDKEI